MNASSISGISFNLKVPSGNPSRQHSGSPSKESNPNVRPGNLFVMTFRVLPEYTPNSRPTPVDSDLLKANSSVLIGSLKTLQKTIVDKVEY